MGKFIKRLTVSALVMVGMFAALLPTAHAATVQLSGEVEDRNGSPVAGATLTFHDAVTGLLTESIDATDGSYALSIDDGIYDITVIPPAGTGLGELREEFVVVFADQTRDFVIPTILDGPIVSGTVSVGGVGLSDVVVEVSGVPATTDTSGAFAVEIEDTFAGIGIFGTQSATTPAFSISAWADATNDVSFDLDLPPVQAVAITVVDDATGLPLEGTIRIAELFLPFASLPVEIWADGWWAHTAPLTGGAGSLLVFAPSVHVAIIEVEVGDGRWHPEEWNGQSTQEIRVPSADAGSDGTVTIDGTVRAGGVPLAGIDVDYGQAVTDAAGQFQLQSDLEWFDSIELTNWDPSRTDVPQFDSSLALDVQTSTTFEIDLPAIEAIQVSVVDTVSGQPIDAMVAASGDFVPFVNGAVPQWSHGHWYSENETAVGGSASILTFAGSSTTIDISYQGEYFSVPWDGLNPTVVSVPVSDKAQLTATVTAGGVPVTAVTFMNEYLTSPTGAYSVSRPPTDIAWFELWIDGYDPAIQMPVVSVNGWIDLQTDVHLDIGLPAMREVTVQLVDEVTGLPVDGHVALGGYMTPTGLDLVNDRQIPEDWSINGDSFNGEITFPMLDDGTAPVEVWVTGYGPTEFFEWSGDGATVTIPVRYGNAVPDVPFTTGAPGASAPPILGESLMFTILACTGGVGTWELTLGSVVAHTGSLVENPVGSGEYQGMIPPLADAGIYELGSGVDCDGDGNTDDVSSQLLDYLDPSGQVFDCQGNPLENVEVTLWRADNETDPLLLVPDGSDIMSPANRANPSYTTATGYYRWDTIPGWYQVRANIPGVGIVSSERLVVPPERFGVDLVFEDLNCASAPTPDAPAGETPTPAAETPAPTAPVRTPAVPVEPPPPIVGNITGGELRCSVREGARSGEAVQLFVVEVPAVLSVWFDREHRVSISGGSVRFNDVLPHGGLIEIPLTRTTGTVNAKLSTTLITGAPYTTDCPEPVMLSRGPDAENDVAIAQP